jgi:hypothetical protein
MKKEKRNQIEALVQNWAPSEIDGAIEILESMVWKMRTVYVEVCSNGKARVERTIDALVHTRYDTVLEEISGSREVYSFHGKAGIGDAQEFMAIINKMGGVADPIVDYVEGHLDVEKKLSIACNDPEMEKYFNMVANPNDWRAPIDAVIAMGKFMKCKAAVEFFTSTELIIVYESKGGKVRVQATGYRNGPAGP